MGGGRGEGERVVGESGPAFVGMKTARRLVAILVFWKPRRGRIAGSHGVSALLEHNRAGGGDGVLGSGVGYDTDIVRPTLPNGRLHGVGRREVHC